MQYLFDCWGSLRKRLLRPKYILLCVDFDGTITPIKPRPGDVVLCADMRLLLRKISRHRSFTVGIISGRGLKDLKQRVGIAGLIYAGNHGLEIVHKKKNFIYPAAKKSVPVISSIARKLTKKLSSFPQAILEQKHLSLSLHYRLVKKRRVPQLKGIFLQIIKPYLAAQKIRVTHGKKVWEVRPPIEWDKGKALLWLVQRLKHRKIFVIYVGDDLTDEDAFRSANKIGGVSILVGRRRNSRARYYLRSAKDTQKFLEEIYKERCRK